MAMNRVISALLAEYNLFEVQLLTPLANNDKLSFYVAGSV